jgi:hypothetical protein
MQYALWGNKTDLSMLVDASKLDVNASVRGTAAGAGAGGNLILDDYDAVWKMLDLRPDGGWRTFWCRRETGCDAMGWDVF